VLEGAGRLRHPGPLAAAKPIAHQGHVSPSFDPPYSLTTFHIGINDHGLITVQCKATDGNTHPALASLLQTGPSEIVTLP